MNITQLDWIGTIRYPQVILDLIQAKTKADADACARAGAGQRCPRRKRMRRSKKRAARPKPIACWHNRSPARRAWCNCAIEKWDGHLANDDGRRHAVHRRHRSDLRARMLIIVGFGNPGAQYAPTGTISDLITVTAMAKRWNFGPVEKKFQSEAAEGEIAGVRDADPEAANLLQRKWPRRWRSDALL